MKNKIKIPKGYRQLRVGECYPVDYLYLDNDTTEFKSLNVPSNAIEKCYFSERNSWRIFVKRNE